MQMLVIATCFTESSLNYNIKHYGKFDKTTIGVCGLKSNYWIDEIKEINKDNINSLYAGSLVLKYLLNKYNNNLVKALQHYKGANKNLEPVNRVIKIYKEIK